MCMLGEGNDVYVVENQKRRLGNTQTRPCIQDYEGKKKREECFLCGKRGHLARECRSNREEEA